MPMYDVITIGSASLDIVVKSKNFTLSARPDGSIALCEVYGAKMDVDELLLVSGGGATNVAVGCARLGLKSAVICEIGKDFPGRIVSEDLKDEGVDDQFIVSERLEQTAVSVLLVAKEGGRSALTHRGAAYELESRDITWEALEKTRSVHLGTLGADKQLIIDLFEFFSTREICVSWTPSLKDLEIFTLAELSTNIISCDVMVLNAQEWQTVTQIKEEFLRLVPLIIVTDGSNGGKVFNEGKQLFEFNATQVAVVEETGAGDAFATGILSGIIMGKSLIECVEWGKKNASSVIQFLGAKKGLLTLDQIG